MKRVNGAQTAPAQGDAEEEKKEDKILATQRSPVVWGWP